MRLIYSKNVVLSISLAFFSNLGCEGNGGSGTTDQSSTSSYSGSSDGSGSSVPSLDSSSGTGWDSVEEEASIREHCNYSLVGEGVELQGVGSGLGTSVDIVGDMNGDDIPELLVGGSRGSNGVGRAYIIFGSDQWHEDIEFAADLNTANNGKGFAISLQDEGVWNQPSLGATVISARGDFNGDGRSDFLVAAPGADDSNQDSGMVYGIFGKEDDSPILLESNRPMSGFIIRGIGQGSELGRRMDVGDLNNDGVPDMLFCEHSSDVPGVRAYVVFGIQSAGEISLASISMGQGGYSFESSLSSERCSEVSVLPDVNNDGVLDVAIGVSGVGENEEGRVYVAFGKEPMAGSEPIDLDVLEKTENGYVVTIGSDSELFSIGHRKVIGFNRGGGQMMELAIGASRLDGSADSIYIIEASPGGTNLSQTMPHPVSVHEILSASRLGVHDFNEMAGDQLIVCDPCTECTGSCRRLEFVEDEVVEGYTLRSHNIRNPLLLLGSQSDFGWSVASIIRHYDEETILSWIAVGDPSYSQVDDGWTETQEGLICLIFQDISEQSEGIP